MKIIFYKRVLFDEPLFGIHRNLCSCSSNKCGKKVRTSGWTIYFLGYAICIGYNKPKQCDAPF